MPVTSDAISIEGVRKTYGTLKALDGVEFSIRRGEFFGLLGPNGAGKSTLIGIIAGLVRMDAGRVAVLGHDNRREYRAARRALGVVPQELVFDPFFSVRECLRIQAGYYGCGREYWPWIERLLDELDLASKAGATIRQLSGGMKRRVLIAQALVHKPPVVILDEPTAGVDVELRRTLWRFARKLHAEGTTVVLTTHYLEEAEELCQRIAILDRGRLKALEGTGQILARHPFRFLRLTLDGDFRLPPGLEPCVVSRLNGSLELKLKREEQPIGEVLESVRGAGFRIVDVRTREPTLEDVFLELTGERA
ncbi:MAG: ABC transporter ATP-binding protein [Gammaproteobacteria bacterium]|nr:ABC transporter ATP-binding protein [Gammaproteobacteria bacterium]